jgi:hypothetical protein
MVKTSWWMVVDTIMGRYAGRRNHTIRQKTREQQVASLALFKELL